MNVRDLLRDSARRIGTSCPESPRLDAEILLAHGLDVTRSFLFANPETELSGSQAEGPAQAN